MAKVDISLALDLRDDSIRSQVSRLLLKIRESFLSCEEEDNESQELPCDGLLFASLFIGDTFKEVVEFTPTAIIANFDITYEEYRIKPSRVILNDIDLFPVKRASAQIQACVRDSGIISNLQEFKIG